MARRPSPHPARLPPSLPAEPTPWTKNPRLIRQGLRDLEYLPRGRYEWNMTLAALAFSAAEETGISLILPEWRCDVRTMLHALRLRKDNGKQRSVAASVFTAGDERDRI